MAHQPEDDEESTEDYGEEDNEEDPWVVWMQVLERSNLSHPDYVLSVLAYTQKFNGIKLPFDLLHKEYGSNRIQTIRLKPFFRFVGMSKPGHRARFLFYMMKLGVERGIWPKMPLNSKQQCRLWKDATTVVGKDASS